MSDFFCRFSVGVFPVCVHMRVRVRIRTRMHIHGRGLEEVFVSFVLHTHHAHVYDTKSQIFVLRCFLGFLTGFLSEDGKSFVFIKENVSDGLFLSLHHRPSLLGGVRDYYKTWLL